MPRPLRQDRLLRTVAVYLGRPNRPDPLHIWATVPRAPLGAERVDGRAMETRAHSSPFGQTQQRPRTRRRGTSSPLMPSGSRTRRCLQTCWPISSGVGALHWRRPLAETAPQHARLRLSRLGLAPAALRPGLHVGVPLSEAPRPRHERPPKRSLRVSRHSPASASLEATRLPSRTATV